MKKYRLITPALTNLGWIPAGTVSEYKDGKYSFMITRDEDYQGGFSERRWVVPQEYINNRPRVFEELKEGACFSHEELREAFNVGKMKGTRWSPEKQQWNYVDVFDTFEEYLGSRGQNKH